MKYIFLVTAVMMLSIYSMQAQSEKKVEKEVIVIKKSDDGNVEKKIISKRIDSHSMTDDQVDSLVQSIIGESGGMIEDINIDVDEVDGEITKKIRIVTNKNGKEEVTEWESSDEDDVFVLEMDSEDEMEAGRKPRVKLGVMLIGKKVDEIIKDSSADKGGVEKGDIIHKMDNQIIYSYNGLMEHLSSYNPRDIVKLTVLRDGKEKVLKLTLDGK